MRLIIPGSFRSVRRGARPGASAAPRRARPARFRRWCSSGGGACLVAPPPASDPLPPGECRAAADLDGLHGLQVEARLDRAVERAVRLLRLVLVLDLRVVERNLVGR